jgi:hypothetical protein
LRLIASVGLEAIAEALGISKGEVSRKVAGKAGWSLEQICKLFEVLGIEAKEKGTKSESEDYVKALETVLRHKLSESE